MSKSEYDYTRSGVVGNFDFIKNRYPNDKIMQEKLENLAAYCLKLGIMIGKDKDYAAKFQKEVQK